MSTEKDQKSKDSIDENANEEVNVKEINPKEVVERFTKSLSEDEKETIKKISKQYPEEVPMDAFGMGLKEGHDISEIRQAYINDMEGMIVKYHPYGSEYDKTRGNSPTVPAIVVADMGVGEQEKDYVPRIEDKTLILQPIFVSGHADIRSTVLHYEHDDENVWELYGR